MLGSVVGIRYKASRGNILSSSLAVRVKACSPSEEHKEAEEERTCVLWVYCVLEKHRTVQEALSADRWFSYTQHPLLIHLKEVWLRANGEFGVGKWQEKAGGLHGRRPPPALQNPTSAARPVLADLKAVSAKTEGAVSRHDTAVAAPELVAG